MRYLNPKADLTFKKVFGEHPDLIISFLNALLPFEKPEEEITQVEYLNPEMVPQTPFHKDSIVDVRCKDQSGRQFIVEMQMMWTSAYKQRVLFNASKAYVSQLDKGKDYELLQPVYSLNLVNDTLPRLPDCRRNRDQESHRRAEIHLHRTAQVHSGQLPREEDAGALAPLPDRNQRKDTRGTGRADGES